MSTIQSSNKASVLIFLLIFLTLFLVCYFPQNSLDPRILPGTGDFTVYYYAVKAFWSGANPYDHLVLEGYRNQELVKFGPPELFMFYPPWLLIILTPLCSLFSLPVSASIWFISNLVFIVVSAVISFKLFYPETEDFLLPCFASVLFFPIVQTLVWGQMALFITLALTGFLYFVTTNKDFLAGICLAGTLLKPHLFLPLYLVILWWTLVNKRHFLLLGSTLCLLILIGLCFSIQPDIFFKWLNPTKSFPIEYHTPTFAGLVRYFLLINTGQIPSWPLFAFPVLAISGSIFWLWTRDKKVLLISVLPTTLCLTLLCAPYAWISDYSALLITHNATLALAAKQKNKQLIIYLTIGLQLIAFLLFGLKLVKQPTFIWFAIGSLILWKITQKIKN